jgi:hypothetical protein
MMETVSFLAFQEFDILSNGVWGLRDLGVVVCCWVRIRVRCLTSSSTLMRFASC